MVEHQVDRMVMVGIAVLVFGILAYFLKDAMKEIMTKVKTQVTGMLDKGFESADKGITGTSGSGQG